MPQKICQTGLRWLWISLVVLILDRISKVMAQHFLVEYDAFPVTSFFNFMLAYNKGAAFSFLGYASGWQVWLFGALAIAVSTSLLVWLQRISYKQWWVAIALTLIIGGALGNLWDRISYGHVIDFIQLHTTRLYWPVFNVADSAICLGAFLLAGDAIIHRKKS